VHRDAGLKGISSKGARLATGFGTPSHIGSLFLTKYLFPFEIASLLLMVAAVGAVVLARRRRGLEGPDERLDTRIHMPRPVWTGTMAEAVGTRVADEPRPEPEIEEVGSRSGSDRQEGGW
jgi:NADH-quinone oxidoreductase subunit J